MASRITARRRRLSQRGHGGAVNPGPPADLLAHRCRSLIRQGRRRQASNALRQLANRDQHAATWVRLGVLLAQLGRTEASVNALKQGGWLHRQRGQPRRATVVEGLIAGVLANSHGLAA
ncbi:MAG: hypothetical protein JKY37_11715 [Nannocystaceae bacterium]|nr:hypothetical protein [Nannocystaceae bacterium]